MLSIIKIFLKKLWVAETIIKKITPVVFSKATSNLILNRWSHVTKF